MRCGTFSSTFPRTLSPLLIRFLPNRLLLSLLRNLLSLTSLLLTQNTERWPGIQVPQRHETAARELRQKCCGPCCHSDRLEAPSPMRPQTSSGPPVPSNHLLVPCSGPTGWHPPFADRRAPDDDSPNPWPCPRKCYTCLADGMGIPVSPTPLWPFSVPCPYVSSLRLLAEPPFLLGRPARHTDVRSQKHYTCWCCTDLPPRRSDCTDQACMMCRAYGRDCPLSCDCPLSTSFEELHHPTLQLRTPPQGSGLTDTDGYPRRAAVFPSLDDALEATPPHRREVYSPPNHPQTRRQLWAWAMHSDRVPYLKAPTH